LSTSPHTETSLTSLLLWFRIAWACSAFTRHTFSCRGDLSSILSVRVKVKAKWTHDALGMNKSSLCGSRQSKFDWCIELLNINKNCFTEKKWVLKSWLPWKLRYCFNKRRIHYHRLCYIKRTMTNSK
jgi:hypothetical protein